jgi:hypothetical protein
MRFCPVTDDRVVGGPVSQVEEQRLQHSALSLEVREETRKRFEEGLAAKRAFEPVQPFTKTFEDAVVKVRAKEPTTITPRRSTVGVKA